MSSLNIAYDLKPVVGIEPNAHAAGAVNGAEFDTQDFDEALILWNVGVVGTSVDLKVQETDTSGSGYVDISGAAFTQILTAGDQVIVKARLKLTGARKRFMRLVMTVTTSASDASAAVLLFRGGKGPYGTLDFNV